MRARAQHPVQGPAPFYSADIQFRPSVLLGPGPRTGGILLINETCIPRDTLYLRATCAKQTLSGAEMYVPDASRGTVQKSM